MLSFNIYKNNRPKKAVVFYTTSSSIGLIGELYILCIDPSVYFFKVLNVLADHVEHVVIKVVIFLRGNENKLLIKLGIDANGEFFLCFHNVFLSITVDI